MHENLKKPIAPNFDSWDQLGTAPLACLVELA